jgi:hypothetical protein
MIRRAIKFVLLASSLIGGGLLALAATEARTVDGSGVAATESRPVGDVTDVTLSGVGDLTIVRGAVPALRVTADDNILPALETRTSGRKLTLRPRSWTGLKPKTKIAYTLVVPHLDALTVSGAGAARADRVAGDSLTVKVSGAGRAVLRDVEVSELTVDASGSGAAAVGGDAGRLVVRVSGAGRIDAAECRAAGAEVRASGSGTAGVWATDALDARASGSGTVKYRGAPDLTRKVSGAGRVLRLE